MHQALVLIILDEICTKFPSEDYFVEKCLQLTKEEWQEWKEGKKVLNQEAMQRIKSLFTDYEWMLMQKVAEQTMFFPEKQYYVVQQFRRLKAMIAKKWIETPYSTTELITKTVHSGIQDIVTLKISLSYGEWGYDDILTFSMPAYISKKIECSSKGLLEWVNRDLEDTYVEQTKIEE